MNKASASRDMDKFIVRLPTDLREWIRAEAAVNAASQNSEIIRCIRERKDRTSAARRRSTVTGPTA